MRALPYIIAFIAGLFMRTLAAYAGGINYTMDGADWLVAVVCIIAVWSFKGAFLPKRKRASKRDRRY